NGPQKGTLGGLAALEILDSFGQRSLLTFIRMEVNPALASASFQFKTPAGAEVIRPLCCEFRAGQIQPS
ncbi:MAG: hypothetical protein Q8K22_13635, partial [Rhodoferax sp.]|nr:hypothetical protein [Rhodoferax sp.]